MRLALPLLAFMLVAASCDESVDLVEGEHAIQPHDVEVIWCPEQEVIRWTFDFGTTGAQDQAHVEWPGSVTYSLSGEDGGAGGGFGFGGTSCGVVCDPTEVLRRPTRWRVSHTVDVDLLPRTFEVSARYAPCHGMVSRVVVRARFELGTPRGLDTPGCYAVPVDTVTRLLPRAWDPSGD